MTSPTEITPARLLRLIGTPDAPAIVDICLPEDLALDPWLVPGAFRRDWTDAAGLAERLADRRAVICCQKGRKLSQGVAAILRAHGIPAETLEGGQIAWRAAGLPSVRDGAVAPGGLWVTRARPKVDRIAVPWLIRRFADQEARFLFVAPSEVAVVADRFGAVLFDAEGADIADGDGRCSFDAALAHLGLRHARLGRMAAVIRAADLGGDAPEAAGVLAILLGLSRQHRDDLAQLGAGMIVMDALYRWARDAADETHREMS